MLGVHALKVGDGQPVFATAGVIGLPGRRFWRAPGVQDGFPEDGGGFWLLAGAGLADEGRWRAVGALHGISIAVAMRTRMAGTRQLARRPAVRR